MLRSFRSLSSILVVYSVFIVDGSLPLVKSMLTLYEIVDDCVYNIVNATIPNHEVLHDARRIPQSRVVPHIDNSRQEDVWNFIATFDSYKKSPSYHNLNGRPTLQNFKYVIVPIWWNDMDPNDPSLQMDPSVVLASFESSQQYYIDMSWGKMTVGVEYTALEQQLFEISSVSPGFGDTESSARAIVDSKGYIRNEDYNGICLMYFTSQSGPFSGEGGWGDVNSNAPFFWTSYPGWFNVTRHEIGHNFGHSHHLSVSYEYRKTRPLNVERIVPYDGYDMMSGGNHFAVSHFAAASKWFFNWIPDSSIILMQPEGPTKECPSCYQEGTFILSPFDDKTLPPTSSRKMGVHIPIVRSGNRLYSYWLSYKTGVDGIAQNGVTAHLSWFDVGNHFGASYDSLNFDAFGNSDTTEDSFVIENTCFHLAPPGYLKDRALIAGYLIQPVVCVDSVDPGISITVSVTFLDEENPPPPKVTLGKIVDLQCGLEGSSSGTITLNPTMHNMVHVQNAGDGGEVTLMMCTSSGTASAYFHDDYPYASLSFGSEPAYGSYKSLFTSQTCSSMDSLTYQSDYGQTYILIPPNTAGSTIQLEVSCTFSECLSNQYVSNGNCVQCPQNRRSNPGSKSLADCQDCPGGTFLPHPLSPQCAMLETYEKITSASQWRVWAPHFDTYSGWSFDVPELEFYNNLSCDGSPIDTTQGTALESSNVGSGWGPSNAFDGWFDNAWGGYTDSDGIFHVGMDFGEMQQVRCIKLYRGKKHYAMNVRIQANVNGKWKNAWIEKNLAAKVSKIDDYLYNIISIDYSNQSQPSASPSSPVGDCNDSPFRFRLKKDGERITRGCAWVAKKDTGNRCALQGVSSMCKGTCGDCKCIDGESRFIFPWRDGMIAKSCEWVAEKQTRIRCAVTGMIDTCRATCNSICIQ